MFRLVAFLCILCPGMSLYAEQIFQLKNGLVVRGFKVELRNIKDGMGAAAAQDASRPIWLIDDGLRRVHFHGKGMTVGQPIDVGDLETPIEFWQPEPLGGKTVAGLGTILGTSPFNEFGRRVLTMQAAKENVQIVQGIVELNRRYAKLMALKGRPSMTLDMRVATSSIDSPTIRKILRRQLDQTDLDERLKEVRFFMASERYADARTSLQDILADFPVEAAELKPQLVSLAQQQATQLLEEAETRANAGQYVLAREIMTRLLEDGVGFAAIISVKDALAKLDAPQQEAANLVQQLKKHVASLEADLSNTLQPVVDEIAAGLSADTIARLSDYSRLGDAVNIPLDNRISLAIAGWILGAGSGEQNLNVAISLVKVRDLVAEYLGSANATRRKAILDELRVLEGSQPEYIDRLLPQLTPPRPLPEDSAVAAIDGMYSIEVATAQARYLVQFPPEYNPLRQYPCVVALHESRSRPASQLDWWAGVHDPQMGMRGGHATRNGFIVVAPQWSRDRQRVYEYTRIEHHRVLAAVRDAMRRVSIDSDRVFIAGHGEGATAAWDIALSHPDIWAGMIAISGSPDKTVHHYDPNSLYMPMYLVMGALDQNMADGAIMNDYMSFNHDAMVVKYRGRGREYFYDEIHQLFDWMMLSSHERRALPKEIETKTMRTGDQFFWWLELGDLKPEVVVDPVLWDRKKKRIVAGQVMASIGSRNQIRVGRLPSESFTVMLRPDPDLGIDLNEDVVIRHGTRSYRVAFDGSVEYMLEDARRRADRRRPFWTSRTVP